MSIADAMRTRALEARVTELERRLDALEQGGPSSSSLWGRIGVLQAQINLLRRTSDDPVKTDDAA